MAKKKKHRSSIDLSEKTWKKIKVDAFNQNISPKKLMQEIVEAKYR